MKNAEFFSPCRKAKLSFGFTLAEVLITLGIIGIVAAITIPSLVQKYKVMVLRNQFKTAESVLQQALQKSITELGYTNVNEFTIPGRQVNDGNFPQLQSDIAQLNEIWLKQFKIIKKLSVREYTYYDRHGITSSLGSISFDKSYDCAYILSNGILVTPLKVQGSTGSNHPGQFRFLFDTNGLKGPNRLGYDVFPYYSVITYDKNFCSSSGHGCYYYAAKNLNPVYDDKDYWDTLYKPKSYFEKK